MKDTKCGEKGHSHADRRKVTQDFEQPKMTDTSYFPYSLLPPFRCGQRKAGWGYCSPQWDWAIQLPGVRKKKTKPLFSGTFHAPGGSESKESACNAGDLDSMPGLERFPWRRTWQPTSVFLPGESPGTEKPGGCSSWDGKELDMIEQLSIQHSTITTTTKILAKSITTTTEILAKSNLKQNGELQDLRIPSRRGWFSC